jgi:hypothetical protein
MFSRRGAPLVLPLKIVPLRRFFKTNPIRTKGKLPIR